jgi:hypothetical protein
MNISDLKLHISPHLLWEYNLGTFNFDCSKHIVIERIIQRGNLKDWRLAYKIYGKSALIEVVEDSKQLSQRDRDFTRLMINSPLIYAEQK